MSRRTERVAEQIRAELARLLREDTTDPRIRLVTLIHVDLSPDFRNARVHWSTLSTDEEEAAEPIQQGLESAASFLRRGLARNLPLKRVPALEFRYDPSIVRGAETLALLREIQDGSAE